MNVFTKNNLFLVLAFLILLGLVFAGTQMKATSELYASPAPEGEIQFVSTNSDTIYINSYYCYPIEELGAEYRFKCKPKKLWWKNR